MDAQIILIALLVAPVLLLMILRVNAAQVFLSLCLGAVLVQFVAPDAATLLASTQAHGTGAAPNQSYVNLGLLLLPVVLTTTFLIRSIRGNGRLAFNLLPAIGVGVLLTLLAVPLLSYGLTSSIRSLDLWSKLESLQTLIISLNTLLVLMSLWMSRPKHHVEEKK